MVEHTCIKCSRKFLVRNWESKNGLGVYCSRACRINKVKCICRVCFKDFYAKPAHIKKGVGKHCSRKCQGIAYKTQLLGQNNPFYGKTHSEDVIKKLSLAKKGKPCNFIKTKFQKGDPRVTGSNNPIWKGDNVGYGALHEWVYRVLGKPMNCAWCSNKERKRFTWANISREYKRDICDWINLCYSCHKIYDLSLIKTSFSSQRPR